MAELEQQLYQTKRATVPEAEEILGKPFKVLNDGFVRLVDYMGDDQAIVQAARTSYGKGTKKISEDSGLIRYLMRHRHTTPLEMVEFKFHVRVPMDCWRQWIRHRTANVNEYSTRYSEAIDSAQKTDKNEWRLQSDLNKQGSSGVLKEEDGVYLSDQEEQFQIAARKIYEERLKLGVAREQARKDLPLSTYTEAYWKIDLHNLFHFLGLRMDSHAQLEIRSYADTIADITKKVVPIAYQAFEDYRLNGTFLSELDRKAIRELIMNDASDVKEVAEETFSNKRERAEFLEKWNKITDSHES